MSYTPARVLTKEEEEAHIARYGPWPPNIPMEPPIEDSIVQTGPDQWGMGTRMLCERLTGPVPADTVASWRDDGSTYAVRPNPTPITTKTPPTGDSAAGRFYAEPGGRAAYAIGSDTICKVSAWREGVSSEAATMRFVEAKEPSIPIPKVYHYWTDSTWGRSYLIMSRIRGRSLEDSWLQLSPKQRSDLAWEVAGYARLLAQHRSDRFETVDGVSVPYFGLSTFEEDNSLPIWVPLVGPPFTAAELSADLLEQSGLENGPTFEEGFIFAHLDLSTTNVLLVDPIPEDPLGESNHEHRKGPTPEPFGQPKLVAGLIDWQIAGYVPAWWYDQLVAGSEQLMLHPDKGDIWAWIENLRWSLTMYDVIHFSEWYQEFNRARDAKEEAAIDAREEAALAAKAEAALDIKKPVPIEKTDSESQS